jgi:hypothetical protein
MAAKMDDDFMSLFSFGRLVCVDWFSASAGSVRLSLFASRWRRMDGVCVCTFMVLFFMEFEVLCSSFAS